MKKDFEFESFDFSKKKDQKNFNEFSEYEKGEFIEEQQNEANNIKKKIESGEAKNYEEAEELVAKEDILHYLDAVETYGKPRKELDDYDEKNDYSRKRYNAWVYLGSDHGLEWTRGKDIMSALQTLSFNEILQLTEERFNKLTQQTTKVEDKENFLKYCKYLAQVIFETKVKSNSDLDKFLNSSLEKFIPPDEILSTINENKIFDSSREKVLNKYRGTINLKRHPLFGRNSIFRGFKDREKMVNNAVQEVINRMLNGLDSGLKLVKTQKKQFSAFDYGAPASYGLRANDVGEAIDFFKEAAKNNVLLPNYKDIIKKLNAAIGEVSGSYGGHVFDELRDELGNAETLIDLKLGKSSESLSGKGLEFVPNESGSKRIYLDGQLIGSFFNVNFSSKPTNGEVLAWVSSEVVDHDVVKGIQRRDTVYVWKKGWRAPKQIFEAHAWTSERLFKVYPPEVLADGTIKIKDEREGTLILKEIKIK